MRSCLDNGKQYFNPRNKQSRNKQLGTIHEKITSPRLITAICSPRSINSAMDKQEEEGKMWLSS